MIPDEIEEFFFTFEKVFQIWYTSIPLSTIHFIPQGGDINIFEEEMQPNKTNDQQIWVQRASFQFSCLECIFVYVMAPATK